MSEVENSASATTAPNADAKQRQELIESRLLSSQFGNMVTIMMQSPHHKGVYLPELRRRLVPPLLGQQFRLAEARKKDSGTTVPVGLILWARVSDEIHNRMLQQLDRPFDLDDKEWKSGNNYWIIDVIGPERFVAPLLSDLRGSEFKDKTVYYRSKTENGPEVRTINESGAAMDKTDDAKLSAPVVGEVDSSNSAGKSEQVNGQHTTT